MKLKLWTSKIGDLLACPYRAKVLYWDRLRKTDVPTPLRVGSLAHVIHALFLHPATAEWGERKKKDVGQRIVSVLGDGLDEEAKDVVRRMVELWPERRFRELGFEPLTVELPLRVHLDGGIELLGRADAVMMRGGQPWLVEFKTTSRAPGSLLDRAYNGNFQLLFYTALLKRMLSKPIAGVLATVYVKRKRSPEFIVEPIPLGYNELPGGCPLEVVWETVNLAADIARGIEQGRAPRNLTSCFGFYGTRCEVFELCRYQQREALLLFEEWDPEEHITKSFLAELPEDIRREIRWGSTN